MVHRIKRNGTDSRTRRAAIAAQRSRTKAIAIDAPGDQCGNASSKPTPGVDALRIFVTLLLVAGAGAMCATALAQNTTVTDAPDAPPPLTAADLERSLNSDNPQQAASATNRAPRTTDGVVTEYRDGNRTYLIQVNPQTGARYYVNDADGNGSPESYRDNAESDVNIGKWKITSW